MAIDVESESAAFYAWRNLKWHWNCDTNEPVSLILYYAVKLKGM